MMIALAALPEGAVPLVVGTALALGSLSFVLWPLLGELGSSDDMPSHEMPANDTPVNDTPVNDTSPHETSSACASCRRALANAETNAETNASTKDRASPFCAECGAPRTP
jgi:hypothetical protein